MKTTFLIIAFCLMLINSISAQSDVDMLRYAQPYIVGTARHVGMAGSFGALGGDFSTLATNPAGIAVYKRSEFSFSPSIVNINTQSSFLNGGGSDDKLNFNFGTVGFVTTASTRVKKDAPGWRSWSFGMGYNRIANFNSRHYFEGFNNQNSLMDFFAEAANGSSINNLDPLGSGLAYNTYLIDTANNGTTYLPYVSDSLLQQQNFEGSGSAGELNLAFGGNYNDQFFIGGSFNFTHLRYFETRFYSESDSKNLYADYNGFNYNTDFTARGAGFNFKLGVIYKPINFLRLGAAFHTPTIYRVNESYSYQMIADFDGVNAAFDSRRLATGDYRYGLQTPMKGLLSLGLVIGKAGALNVDYELVDYRNGRFNSYDAFFNFNTENRIIDTKYTTAANLRIGTEWVVNNISLRGGYALFGSPFANIAKANIEDQSMVSYTGGIGVRDKKYFIDLGFAHTVRNGSYLPYTLQTETAPIADQKMAINNFTLTFGVKF